MAEFQHARAGWFDTAVNGLNRLPRPLLALGTLCLFVYAMADPDGFGVRMAALALVPEPLWWLLGAVVAFYFGAREAHHLRVTKVAQPPVVNPRDMPAPPTFRTARTDQPSEGNPALIEWRDQAHPAP